jgi:ribulose-phosphate 3-epimerase
MIEIIPTIFAKTSEEFSNIVRRYEPYFIRASIDVSDGISTNEKTVSGYEELRKISSTLKFDTHLMVENPQDKMADWRGVPVDRFFIHIENNKGVIASLANNLHFNGKKIGLVINPDTDINEIREFVDLVDIVQFMTVQPGAYGRDFIRSVLDKMASFRELYPNVPIAVDGGINLETAMNVREAGATIFFVGSYFHNSSDIKKSLADLGEILN